MQRGTKMGRKAKNNITVCEFGAINFKVSELSSDVSVWIESDGTVHFSGFNLREFESLPGLFHIKKCRSLKDENGVFLRDDNGRIQYIHYDEDNCHIDENFKRHGSTTYAFYGMRPDSYYDEFGALAAINGYCGEGV